jgi:hypothetical protein
MEGVDRRRVWIFSVGYLNERGTPKFKTVWREAEARKKIERSG